MEPLFKRVAPFFILYPILSFKTVHNIVYSAYHPAGCYDTIQRTLAFIGKTETTQKTIKKKTI